MLYSLYSNALLAKLCILLYEEKPAYKQCFAQYLIQCLHNAMSITQNDAFCTHCGKERSPKDNYCGNCGTAFARDLVESTTGYSITLRSFLPLVFDAFESISIKDFFSMLASARLIITKPHEYIRQEKERQLTPVFTMLVMATFTGVFKLAQDPVYSPFLHSLDVESDVSRTAIQLILYIVLALFFGIGSFFSALFWYYLLGIQIDRDLFVRAMMSVFCVFAFIFDAASPLWMPFVQNGSMPWLLPDIIRTLIVTVYSWLVGKGITQYLHATQTETTEIRKESLDGNAA